MALKRIAQALQAAADGKRAAFIPFIMAGDPSLARTQSYVAALTEGGADIVELGVPFSDPVADGVENQRAAQRALAAKTTLAGVLASVRALRDSGLDVPIVLFTYYNPVHRMGPDAFAGRAAASGVDGVIIVDLPPEEAGPYLEAARKRSLATVFLASPTTDDARLKLIDGVSEGFIYYVSRLGVTGERKDLPPALKEDLRRVRALSGKPVAVGFGISSPAQAGRAARCADAVVVGSALVRLIAEQPETAADKLKEAARKFAAALGKENP